MSHLQSRDVICVSLQAITLPVLPPNARYTVHVNECYDWGTFGWFLKTQNVDLTKYKHFIFLNSSVRGPFLPPYVRVRMSVLNLVTRARGNAL